MTSNGDDRLREAGILLPCAKSFGFLGTGLSRCERPYGHTGPHTADGYNYSGARDSEDEARTMFALTQILTRGA